MRACVCVYARKSYSIMKCTLNSNNHSRNVAFCSKENLYFSIH